MVRHRLSLVKRIPLKKARQAKTLTQQALATKANVGQGMVSRLERGLVSHPTWDTVAQIAAALEMDPRELQFGQTSREAKL